MQVYILRHGIAEESHKGGNDADRELTSEGRKKLREVMHMAENVDVLPSLIITSPYLRAVQTAELAMETLGYSEDLLRTDALIPSSDPESVWEEIRVHQGIAQLLLVGHEPLLSRVIAFLLNSPSLLIDLKKGAMVRVDITEFGVRPRGILKWMLVPKFAS